MGRVFPVAYWAAGDLTIGGGGAALPRAHLSTVRQGCGRLLHGDTTPLAFLSRDVLPAPFTVRFPIADTVAQVGQGRWRRVAVESASKLDFKADFSGGCLELTVD